MAIHSLCLVILLSVVCHSQLLTYLQLPKHDGVKRVCTVGTENFTSVVNSAELAIVVFRTTHQFDTVCPDELDSFSEVIAQVLRHRNVSVCQANLSIKTHLGNELLKSEDIYIYKNGKAFPYYGRRTPSAALSFIFKLNSTDINVITGKLDKIAFDAIQKPRIVGFFMKGTADYKAFEDASLIYSHVSPFYAVFDRTVAKHLKLDAVGQINLFRALEKTPVVCPTNPASVADIQAFLEGHKGVVLNKLTEHNLHDPSIFDPNRTLVLAIGDQNSPLGGYFYRILLKITRNNTNNTEFEKLNIVWIEPSNFPALHLMMDVLESTLGIPPTLPAFGTVDLTTNDNAWFDTSSLNSTADKRAEEQNVQVVTDWLNSVLTNTVQTVKIGFQSFVQVPRSQTVTEGDTVTLACVIENPLGDCLWLKDGRNIGYNLSKYRHLEWSGDTTSGDCSLKITDVTIGRDDGEWICEMTGNEENPTITSAPARLTVNPSPTKGEL